MIFEVMLGHRKPHDLTDSSHIMLNRNYGSISHHFQDISSWLWIRSYM